MDVRVHGRGVRMVNGTKASVTSCAGCGPGVGCCCTQPLPGPQSLPGSGQRGLRCRAFGRCECSVLRVSAESASKSRVRGAVRAIHETKRAGPCHAANI